MPYNIHTAETRTDPSDNVLVVTEEEVLTEAIYVMITEGVIPSTVYLVDDYTEEDLEIDVWQEVDGATLEEALNIVESMDEATLEQAQKHVHRAIQTILEEIL